MDSVEDNCNESKKSRLRGDNWEQAEKDLLLQIMRKSAPIVENKSTNTYANKLKRLEWQKVQKKFTELSGKYRAIPQLQGFWRRTKLAAKKSATQHRKALHVKSEDSQEIVDEIESSNSSHGVFIENTMEMTMAEDNSLDFKLNNQELALQGMRHKLEIDKDQPIDNINYSTNNAVFPESSNIEMMISEEHISKMKFHSQELAHQEMRHKLEIDILTLDKEKKKLEIELLKQKLSKE